MSSPEMPIDADGGPSSPAPPRGALLAVTIVVGATLLAYSNTLDVPFLFDDHQAIPANHSIRQFWPPGGLLMPPGNGAAVQRRPVVNVSLAVNYAISGVNPWSYHAFNLLSHVLAALLLLAIVRRTLVRISSSPSAPPHASGHLARNALPLATVIALLWAVHPLLTEAVTYTIQRTEVLAGLFYLLTLYCVIRGASGRRPAFWYAAAAGSCALAMGSKESAVSAPLVVLLYDRVFWSASWREVFCRRWALYAALAASWTVVLVMLPHGSEGTSLFGHGSQAIEYASAQYGVIAHYLRLCFWPYPLVVDYGAYAAPTVGQVVPYAVLIAVLMLATIAAFRYQPWLGFLGVVFFAVLAPSSSVIPLFQQVAAEKRMYLPLAAVVTAVVIVGYFLVRKLLAGRWPSASQRPASLRRLETGLLSALVVALGCVTFARNRDYRAMVTIWSDAVQKCPQNARAQTNLGVAYENLGMTEDAVDRYRTALKLDPFQWMSHRNLGRILVNSGKTEEGLNHLEDAVAIQPDDAEAQNSLGAALAGCGRADAAIEHLQGAVKLDPEYAEAYNNLGSALLDRGQIDQAVAQFQTALSVNPEFAAARCNLNRALAERKRRGNR